MLSFFILNRLWLFLHNQILSTNIWSSDNITNSGIKSKYQWWTNQIRRKKCVRIFWVLFTYTRTTVPYFFLVYLLKCFPGKWFQVILNEGGLVIGKYVALEWWSKKDTVAIISGWLPSNIYYQIWPMMLWVVPCTTCTDLSQQTFLVILQITYNSSQLVSYWMGYREGRRLWSRLIKGNHQFHSKCNLCSVHFFS